MGFRLCARSRGLKERTSGSRANSQGGREAVVGLLGPGDFFGEGCLAGQRVRMGNATAITSSAIAIVAKGRMLQLLRTEHSVAGRFIAS